MITVEPQYARSADGSKVELARDPFLWFDNKDETVCYQNGRFYAGVGNDTEILEKDVPAWFWEDLKKSYLPEAIAKWGIKIPYSEKEKKGEPEKVKMWECDECDAVIPLKNKGTHVMVHRRKNKREAKSLAIEYQREVEHGESTV